MAASDIYRTTQASIVVIVTTDRDGNALGQGSGFIVAKDKVVTNHHVPEGASDAVVSFSDGMVAAVRGVIADSPTRDLIVLDVPTGSRLPLRLGDELSLHQGDAVYAVGAPKGLQLSITNGIVSGFRDIDEKFMIQATAAIAPGSSGGPLFDSRGSVVGVTTSLLSDTPGIYFSIGIGDVRRLLRTPDVVVTPFHVWAEENATVANGSGTSPEVAAIQKLIDEKNYEPAKQQLTSLLQEAPNDPNLHRMMGEVALFQGDSEAALLHLKAAVDRMPDDIATEGLYAFALFVVGRYNEAAQFQESVVKASPTATNLAFLSEAYYGQKKFKDAETIALEALRQDPAEETALSVIAGNVYRDRSSSRISWTDLQSRLGRISQDSFWVRIAKAIELTKKHLDKDAIDILDKAKKDLFPDPVAYLMLSFIYAQNDELGMARDEEQEGLVAFPDDVQLLGEAVSVSLMSHDDTGAYRSASRLREIAGGTREELYSSCLYSYGVGQSSDAVANCSALVRAYPKDHTAHSNLGWSALDGNQFGLARQEFEQAYNLVADKWSTLTYTEVVDLIWGTAIADYYSGDRKDCKKLLEFLRRSYPAALSVTGLQRLPLIWSTTTMTRIEAILREIRP